MLVSSAIHAYINNPINYFSIKKIVKRPVKYLGLRLKKALGLLTPPVIMAYRGYGTTSKIKLGGHVLDDRLLYESSRGDKKRKNLRSMLSRYLSSPIPDVRVGIEFNGQYRELTTDANGLFETEMEFDPPLDQCGWHTAEMQVLDQIVEEQEPMVEKVEVFVCNERCRRAIISDVDDTILISHATEFFRKIRLLLTKNSKTRLPFPGVAAFYKALQEGTDPNSVNPIFYVSSSEWNLYDFLVDFCEVQEIPRGPFLLQNFKSGLGDLLKSGGGTHSHKRDKIEHLMEWFSDLQVVLIGDSGQRDAQLYADVAMKYPGRIQAIYIRDVSGRKKDERVRRISRQLEELGVDMLLVEDTAAAAKHALSKGLISQPAYESLAAVGDSQ